MKRAKKLFGWVIVLAVACLLLRVSAAAPVGTVDTIVSRYCLDCHDQKSMKGELNLETLSGQPISQHPDQWERVVRRLQARQMPPAKRTNRPTEQEYRATIATLVERLDAVARQSPRPGRTETVRRLNRAEYQNAIRDLLALEIDAASLLPADSASHGFDNVTVGTLSATLLDRYLSAAQKISRLAVGVAPRFPSAETIRIKPDLTQEERVEGLPFGTRGGALIAYNAPQDGEYEIQVRLTRDRNDEVEGLREPHQLMVLLEGRQVQTFTVNPPPPGEGHQWIDAQLKCRLPMKAGPHRLGVTFLKNPASLLETKRQPYAAHFNFHRHPRIGPAIYQVSIAGPQPGTGPGDTPSRRRIFIAQPKSPAEETAAAKKILSQLARRAWRRPVQAEDVDRLMPSFEEGRRQGALGTARPASATGHFETGIEQALSAILVSREFLFRVEAEPAPTEPGKPYQVSDIDLASRLSFFLWSSIPDDELLDLAERRQLSKSGMLEKQARRMLADPRAQSLVNNFADQWLSLRNLDAITPDGRRFPDFDDNLRQAMRRETELLFGEIVREDRSVLELLRTDHAWLNERLARHYDIAHVYGSHFRRVPLGEGSQRGGLLRQASVLTVTSYATRTSPVLRGKWVLENLMGTPPPPPLPDVPALDDSKVSESLPIRARLAAHRDKPACAGCHAFIDPPGFALENFDAIGRWRVLEEGMPVDASGGSPDGSSFIGVDGLEENLLKRPELFVTTLTEKLLTFALGRGMEDYDGPAVRQVVRGAEGEYRFSKIIDGIVGSTPFKMRQSQPQVP